MKAKKARLDADKTAKPLTRIVVHLPMHKFWNGRTLIDPEYESSSGERLTLMGKDCKGCGKYIYECVCYDDLPKGF